MVFAYQVFLIGEVFVVNIGHFLLVAPVELLVKLLVDTNLLLRSTYFVSESAPLSCRCRNWAAIPEVDKVTGSATCCGIRPWQVDRRVHMPHLDRISVFQIRTSRDKVLKSDQGCALRSWLWGISGLNHEPNTQVVWAGTQDTRQRAMVLFSLHFKTKLGVAHHAR